MSSSGAQFTRWSPKDIFDKTALSKMRRLPTGAVVGAGIAKAYWRDSALGSQGWRRRQPLSFPSGGNGFVFLRTQNLQAIPAYPHKFHSG